ncbi:EamA family transporter [Iodobacter fluviatilis]|uniref:O-acetylserine/cysteine efflux transporter n=1 Tax=Iodobacter fluviatilis TaxID=537 RepID=A0A377Q429_9NEIS|nr:EamA family transporter [Iodobacter fluviatilis]TCU90433.1 O-acetylserine/cysteine efflux transporter [Iodobacter fluviatilis]STQ89460.1 Probable amino-acid metabolite efflux pump [Iodobacter fluviatilis]
MKPADLLLALFIVLIWGLNFAVIKLGLNGIPPLLLGAMRFVLASLPVLFIPRPKVPLKLYLAYGLTISVGQFAFLFCAIHLGMPAGLASVVLQAQAFFTLILSALLLNERWHKAQLAGLILASTGLAFIGSAHGLSMPLTGFLLTLSAACMWALGNIITRKVAATGPVNMFGFVVWASLVPPLPFLALSFAFEGPAAIQAAIAHLSWGSLAAVAYLSWIATLLGYGLWSHLLSHYPANKVAPFSLLVPVVGLITAYLVFGETLSPLQWAGTLLLMSGLLINLFGVRIKGIILLKLKRA